MEAQSRLFDLPTDIMSELTPLLDLADLYRLLLVGNGQLTLSLGRFGALTQLKVKIRPTQIRFPKSWPVLLNVFKSLRKLTITSPSSSFSHFDNQHMPPTLTYLDIRSCLIPVSIIRNGIFNVSKILPNLETLRTNIDINASSEAFISTFPQKLSFLQIGQYRDSLPLTESLTRLSKCILTFSDVNMAFPPNLIRLRLEVARGNDVSKLSPFLPHTLEWLTVSKGKDYSFYENCDLTGLPPNLTCLKLDIQGADNWGLSLLPSRLTRLSIWSIYIDLLYQLPSSLLFLSIRSLKARADSITSPSGFVENLPRSLTHLCIREAISRFKLQGSIAMPPNMIHWEVHDCRFSDEASFLSLPSATLSFLSVSRIGYEFLNFPALPQLKELRIQKAPHAFNLLNHLALHSTSLKTLAIVTRIVKHPGVKYSKQRNASNSTTSPFPHPTTHRFSQHLRYVDISGRSFLGDVFIAQMLPNSIKKLRILPGHLVTNQSISIMSSWTNLGELTILHASNLTGACFKDLPRQLTTLIINHTENIQNQDIAHLPPSLTHIELKSAIHLTDACVPLLPPSTTSFHADLNANFTPGIIHQLHPRLRIETSTRHTFTALHFTITKCKVQNK